jgi:hypothetical protein
MLEKLEQRRIKYLIQCFCRENTKDYLMVKNYNGIFIFYINEEREESVWI